LGLQLGNQAYKAYGEKLAVTIDKMLLVSEVATLSRRPPRVIDEGAGAALDLDMSVESRETSQNTGQAGGASGRQASIHGRMPYNSLGNTNKQLIMQQLEQWEEPVRVKHEVRYKYRFKFIIVGKTY
jgi:hypothetical protein